MVSKHNIMLCTVLFAFAVELQTSSAALSCDSENISEEFNESPRETYKSIRVELESMNVDESSDKYQEKMTRLNALDSSWQHLDEQLFDFGISVLDKMKVEYLEHGGMISPKLKSIIVDVLSGAEAKYRPQLMNLKEELIRCRSFIFGQ